MKDFHSHICYGIDDGSKTIEESITILKEARASGITDVFLTPHYIENTKFNANNKKKEKIKLALERKLKEENIDINLYLSNEVYINENIIKLLKKYEINTINNTNYILIELGMFKEIPQTKPILLELLKNDYIPVIAHPERYIYIDSKLEYIKELRNAGCLFQGNYQSLFGKYGSRAKKMLKKMLKEDLIDFLGSDIHHKEDFNLDKLEKKLKKIVKSDEKVLKLLEGNVDKYIFKK